MGDDRARPESPFHAKAQAEVRTALKGKTKIKEKDINKLTYLNNVIKQTLRVHPVVSLVPRLCCETVELGEYTVPAGSRVVVNAWAIMRDARWWEGPERFMPEKFEKLEALDSGGVAAFDYIPFGGGRRFFPRMAFAYASRSTGLMCLFSLRLGVAGAMTPRRVGRGRRLGYFADYKGSYGAL
ncbi:hypothetical protein HPP92_013112 [Vanilla planifolia]|uniref:Cytochrome P450 n=1 Tax=Vanilla planifolia TaxID=51239 RepID=A0A835QV07_VANPL|nr:hypothetical protein HPP92_013112 [Vanilla planifolia]